MGMTIDELRDYVEEQRSLNNIPYHVYSTLIDGIDALEQEPTTKNDLGVDREQLKNMIRGLTKWYVKRDDAEVGQPNTAVGLLYDDVMFGIDRLPSVTPQEPQTFKWCDTCKEYDQEKHCCHRWSKVIRDTVEEMKQEQEPILDKIRAEIDNALSDGMVHKKTVLGIIDKYKAESEDT